MFPHIARYTKLLLKMMVAIAVFVFLFFKLQIKVSLFDTLLQHPVLFSATILVCMLTIILGTQRWHLLNSAQGMKLGFIRTIKPTYLGVAFNNLLPGAVGGDLIRSYYLFKIAPDKKSTAFISIFLDRMLGFLGLLILIGSVIVCRIHQLHDQRALFWLLFLFAGFCVGVLLTFSVLVVLPHRFDITTLLERRYVNKRWVKSTISLLKAIKIYRLPVLVTLGCLMISIFMQVMATIMVILIAKMMGSPYISFSDYILAFGITQVVNLIPATPGGIGIGEMAFANILYLLNPSENFAFATIYLAYRLIGILIYIPGVVYYIPRFLFLKREMLSQK